MVKFRFFVAGLFWIIWQLDYMATLLFFFENSGFSGLYGNFLAALAAKKSGNPLIFLDYIAIFAHSDAIFSTKCIISWIPWYFLTGFSDNKKCQRKSRKFWVIWQFFHPDFVCKFILDYIAMVFFNGRYIKEIKRFFFGYCFWKISRDWGTVSSRIIGRLQKVFV